MSMVTKLDRFIFLLMLILSVASIFFTNVIFADHSAEFAVIEIDGREYGRYSLKEKETRILEIKSDFGQNTVEISYGGVRVLDADCPDKLEVKAGRIDSAGEMLVCLPNRMIIRIDGEREVDSVAY